MFPASSEVLCEVAGYGWHDNEPKGRDILYPPSDGYPTLHEIAGGMGSYEDPITFASDPKLFAPGTRIFDPATACYFMMEDWSAACHRRWSGQTDPNARVPRIALWCGGTARAHPRKSLIDTIRHIATRGQHRRAIIVDPRKGLEGRPLPVNGELWRRYFP